MFCPDCGSEARDSAEFCAGCGASIGAKAPSREQAKVAAGFGCEKCGRPAMPDRLFCTFCSGFLADADSGSKGGLFQRWLATLVDSVTGYVALIVILVIAVEIGGEAGTFLWLLLTAAQVSVWAVLLNRGTTVGKMLFGLRVVRTDGSNPGFGTMLMREWIGKTVSYLFFGLGFWWAVWDKDRQALHDKFAGTVVTTT